MDKLTFELKKICICNRDGSKATQADRWKQLKLMAAQLRQLGFKKMGAKSLKPKHVTALVKNWQSDESGLGFGPISTGTIKNRMAILRWWAAKIQKNNVIPRTNKELGITNRQRLPQYNRAFTLTEQQLADLPRYLQFSLRLQQEFGLRREEAAKFVPARAITEKGIRLGASWTKGGRAREIPISTAAQRTLLTEISRLNYTGSLIPAHMSYRHYLSHRDYLLSGAGIRNSHGLRHHYAQQRYIVLSGGLTPIRLGGPRRSRLNQDEKQRDHYARTILSRELGHSRTEITRIYLG